MQILFLGKDKLKANPKNNFSEEIEEKEGGKLKT